MENHNIGNKIQDLILRAQTRVSTAGLVQLGDIWLRSTRGSCESGNAAPNRWYAALVRRFLTIFGKLEQKIEEHRHRNKHGSGHGNINNNGDVCDDNVAREAWWLYRAW